MKLKLLQRAVLALVALCIPSGFAASLTVDATKSQITLSGTVVGSQLGEQGPGSLTSKFGGTIDVTTSNGQIQITSGSLDPEVNGNWAPGRDGQAASPADLAGKASTLFGPVTGALRDLLVTASSAPKALQ